MKFVRVHMASSVAFLIALLAGVALPAARAEDGPIDKVVKLLKTMQTDLESDEKSEQAVYDKYACWCEETTQRKAQNIEDAKTDMKRLGQEILKQKGTVAVRTDEIAEKKSQIEENEAAQKGATTARTKENTAWQDETAETSQAMAAINEAMGVLMKATKKSAALLQQDSTARLQTSVSKIIEAAPAKALAALSPSKLEALRSFAQTNGKAGYAPQSMTIQGILGDMYVTMGVDVQDSTALEARRNRAFEDYMHEKTKEHAEYVQILTKKMKEKAEAEAMLAEATQAYDDTSKQLEADVKFFDVTKKACQEKTEEWSVRSELRKSEISGVKEALKILTSDEAKKLFAKSIKPGIEATFLQVGLSTAPKNLDSLYAKLKSKAAESHSLRLAALAAQVRTAKAGHFDKVIKAIDDLIGVLGKEQDSDTKKRDECEEQYQDIAQESAKLEWKIKNNEAAIKKLENLIKEREQELKDTIDAIKDTKENIKDMKDERKKENEAFVEAKKADEDSIEILEKAKEAILEFYKKNKVALGEVQGSVKFLQADPMEDPDVAPDASFSGKGKRKGQAKGAVSLLTMVIEDLQAEIVNEVKAEEEAQKAFEEALADAEELLAKLEAKKVTCEECIAKHKKDKEAEEKDKKANEGDLDDQKKEKKSIQEDCDYMIEKYEERRKYREAEAEALSDAKEFLANYYDSAEESLVQASPSKGDFPRISFSRLASPRLRK